MTLGLAAWKRCFCYHWKYLRCSKKRKVSRNKILVCVLIISTAKDLNEEFGAKYQRGIQQFASIAKKGQKIPKEKGHLGRES